MSTYLEKLKDPRWQKKRLGIFNREGFKCQSCRSATLTLHVHHLVYSKGEPWDAPDEDLECLCEWCHTMREMFNEILEKRSRIPTVYFFSFLQLTFRLQGKPDSELMNLIANVGAIYKEYMDKTMANYRGRLQSKPNAITAALPPGLQ